MGLGCGPPGAGREPAATVGLNHRVQSTPDRGGGDSLKVLHVITDSGIGGAGRYLLALFQGIHTRESGITLEAMCPDGALARELSKLGFPVTHLPTGDRSLSMGNLTAVRSVLAGRHYHLIHTHASLAGRLAARLNGQPAVVMTRHRPDRPRTGWQRSLRGCWETALADGVIAVSESVRDSLVAAGLPARMITVIHNGIPLVARRHPHGSPPAADRSPSSTIIGSVARLVPEKGLDTLLKATALLTREFPGLSLILVGDGREKSALTELSHQLGLTGRIHFLGFRADVEDIVAGFDLAALPSLSEGLPLALLELMAAGRPVVASRVGGIPEVIAHEDNGLLVPPGDPAALAAALRRLLTEEGLAARLGSAARATAEERFSAEAMAVHTLDFYRRVLAGRQGNGRRRG